MDHEGVTEPQPAAKGPTPRHGGMALQAVGVAITVILLASLAFSAWWAGQTQRQALDQARLGHLHRVGKVLGESTEVLLADDELSAVRRMVANAAQDFGLSRCRIVLPDGQIVADASPGEITLRDLPAKWDGVAAEETGGGSVWVFPLMVAGRGNAQLEIAPPDQPVAASTWMTQAGIGGIAVAALVALLVVRASIRSRLHGIEAVRQALLAHESGQRSPEALQVNPEWGPEADAWNHLLREKDEQQKRLVLERTRESLQNRRHGGEDLTAACDALSHGLILVDEHLRARYANGAAAALLRTKRDEILGAEIPALVGDERVLSAVREATLGPVQNRTIVEVQRNDASGTGLLRFIVRPVRREDRGVAMIIVEDITQQRVAEESRNAFVAQATHELRTPLTNIRLYAEMALDEGKNDPAVLANCLNVINQETFRLDRMVGDILSIAEIEAGTLTLKKDDVRLDDLFSDLQADFAAQAKDKQLELVFALPPKLPVITADRGKVALALQNLIGNALKYTSPGGKVHVGVVIDDGHLVVDVGDTGIGMDEEACQHIFEKFYRAADRRVAGIKGSGLGLAIAREVVRLHGGDITVQSELDKGSTFTLVLPRAGEAS